MFRASLMNSCSAHRDAGNHPYENNPLETLQSDGYKSSQCHSPSDNKTIPNNWANWLPRFAVGACCFVTWWFYAVYWAVFSTLFFPFDCVKGGAVDIFIKTKQCCFLWMYSGVPVVQKGSLLIKRCCSPSACSSACPSAVVFWLHSDIITLRFHLVYGVRERKCFCVFTGVVFGVICSGTTEL